LIKLIQKSNKHFYNNNIILKKLIPQSEIKKKVKLLAKKISDDYRGKTPVLIGALNGSFIFLSDLIRELNIDIEIDFIKISSYKYNKIPSRKIKLLKDLNISIEKKDVIAIDDIIDSGNSANYLRKLILSKKPATLEFCALLIKENESKLNFKIKYPGFIIENKFVVGYGLDYAQKFRNLKSIYFINN
jgi:hypoxanthine phosphoribosyltransferase